MGQGFSGFAKRWGKSAPETQQGQHTARLVHHSEPRYLSRCLDGNRDRTVGAMANCCRAHATHRRNLVTLFAYTIRGAELSWTILELKGWLAPTPALLSALYQIVVHSSLFALFPMHLWLAASIADRRACIS